MFNQITMAFNVVLLSDASLDLYPENKANKFRVQLSEPLKLSDRRYEAALKEIIVPSRLNYKHQDDDLWVEVQRADRASGFRTCKKHLPGIHYYDNEQHLFSVLDKAIAEMVDENKRLKQMDQLDTIKLLKEKDRKTYKVPIKIKIVTTMRQLKTHEKWTNLETLNRVIFSKSLLELVLGASVLNDQIFAGINYYHHFYQRYSWEVRNLGRKEGFILFHNSPHQKYKPDNRPPNLGMGIVKHGEMAIRDYPPHASHRDFRADYQKQITTYLFPERKDEIPKLDFGHQQLSIFCDFIEPHHVGSTMQPLLRTVAREGKLFDLSSSHESESLQNIPLMRLCYVPVKLQELKEIEVTIEDEHTHLVPFAEGKTLLNLTFRPV